MFHEAAHLQRIDQTRNDADITLHTRRRHAGNGCCAEVAAEVAADKRCPLQHRLRHRLREARGRLQEGAAEAGEAHNAAQGKLAVKAAKTQGQMHRQAIHG